MSLNQIIFEHIDDKYAYGKYAEFTVIMMKENRYINATKLCSQYGKEFKGWIKTYHAKQLISYINENINNKSIIIITGGNKNNQIICGSYVHELLMDSIINYINKSRNKNPELIVVNNLNLQLKGECEVETPYGRIDILTENEIIEVKKARSWKQALGQILVYGSVYPMKQKRIHLFDINNQNLDEIEKIYKLYNVKLSYE